MFLEIWSRSKGWNESSRGPLVTGCRAETNTICPSSSVRGSEGGSVRVRVTFTDAGGYWPPSTTPAGRSEAVTPDKCNIPLPLMNAEGAVIISGAWHQLFEEENKSPRFVKGLCIFGTIAAYWFSSLLQVLLVVIAPWECSWKGGAHPCGMDRTESQLFLGRSRSYCRKEMGYFHVWKESDDTAGMREGDEWDVI